MNLRLITLLSLLSITTFFACDDDDVPTPMIEVPATYNFLRNNVSTVDFSGQTTRLLMGEELVDGLLGFSASEEDLLAMFSKPEGTAPFANAELNGSTKSIRSKVAASKDYFAANTVGSATIREAFDQWISAQVNEVFPASQQLAAPGVPGQIADGNSTRYVNAQGLEYDQMVTKGLIGALVVDQMLNNYLSTSVLDEASNREDNDSGVTEEGEEYTAMEHKWDEAYGYLYGLSANPAEPNLTIGADDSFLNKYLGRMEGDPDFQGISAEIFDAFKKGRAAIVAGEYEIRDEQANIIREKISEIIGVRVVYYLQQAKFVLANTPVAYGTVFHDLSEAYGFIYSLQFTRRPGTDAPYFSASEVDAFLTDLLDDGPNGLWDIQAATLQTMSEEIAAAFKFTVAQAAE